MFQNATFSLLIVLIDTVDDQIGFKESDLRFEPPNFWWFESRWVAEKKLDSTQDSASEAACGRPVTTRRNIYLTRSHRAKAALWEGAL